MHLQRLVVKRGFGVVGGAAADGQYHPEFLKDLGLSEAHFAQEFGPRPLGEAQVVGVIDDARRIRILVIDADREDMAGVGVSAAGCPGEASFIGVILSGGQQFELLDVRGYGYP